MNAAMCDQAFNLKFVAAVEKRPELYNFTMKGYSKKDVTERAWYDVSREVSLTVPECKEKWRNLRSVYVRHLKPQPSGSGAAKKKPYYLASAMEFTLPFVKSIGKIEGNFGEFHSDPSTLRTPVLASEEFAATDSSELRNEEEEDFLQEDNVSFNVTPPTSSLTPVEEIEAASYQNSRKKRRKNSALTEVDVSFQKFLEAKRRKLEESTNNNSESRKMFLLSLLPEIEHFSERQMKLFRRNVFKLIDEVSKEEDPTEIYVVETVDDSTFGE